MTERATVRPPHVKPPAHWSPVPVPEPGPVVTGPEGGGPRGLEPVRYGDWEAKGIAVDF